MREERRDGEMGRWRWRWREDRSAGEAKAVRRKAVRTANGRRAHGWGGGAEGAEGRGWRADDSGQWAEDGHHTGPVSDGGEGDITTRDWPRPVLRRPDVGPTRAEQDRTGQKRSGNVG